MFVDYSTDSVRAKDRFDSWRAAVCSHLITAEAKPAQASGFKGNFKYCSFGGLDISSQIRPPITGTVAPNVCGATRKMITG